MEGDIALFGRSDGVALFGIKMVLPGFTCDKFTALGELEALGVRFIGFHCHIKLLILPIFEEMSSLPAGRQV